MLRNEIKLFNTFIVASLMLLLGLVETSVAQRSGPPEVRTSGAAPRPAGGAAPRISGSTNTVVASSKLSGQKIQTKADQTSYNFKNNVVEAKGNVLITYGDQRLTADYVIVNEKTGDAEAFGSVVLHRGAAVWRGERLKYNLITKVGDSDTMAYQAAPFRLTASKITRQKDNTFELENVKVTTCTNGLEHPHFYLRASRANLVPGKRITASHGVMFLGPVPVFYFPWWTQSLDEDLGIRIRLGYSSRNGAYVLSSYRYAMSEILRGETHLDYRAKRGVGLGQDIRWVDPDAIGMISGYYIDDKEPLGDEDAEDKDIDSTRYRIRLQHNGNLSAQDTLSAKAAYLSDTDILEDFFESEYRESSQPDNYAAYTHIGGQYSVGILARTRLNDFYSQVNRLPELSLAFMRQPVPGTALYYESLTTLANLEMVYAEGSGSEDYSAIRADSSHMLYWPEKLDFLTVVPRAGIRGTYYSETIDVVTENTTEQVPVTNGTTVTYVTRTNTQDRMVEQGAGFRARPEVGAEISFKAFKTWGASGGEMRRHVVEPYANYTLIPSQSLEAEELYQFDGVDSLTKDHMILCGIRNKYQSKVSDQSMDIIDFNLYTILYIDKQEREKNIDDLYFDARFLPTKHLQLWLDGAFDLNGDDNARYNARLQYTNPTWWAIGGEFRHEQDSSSLLTTDITFLPSREWTFNIYGRYELENSQVEEQGGYIQRNLDCLCIRTGLGVVPAYTTSSGVDVEDEFRVMVEFWIRAFPNLSVGGHSRF